jgi:hypothetical protein
MRCGTYVVGHFNITAGALVTTREIRRKILGRGVLPWTALGSWSCRFGEQPGSDSTVSLVSHVPKRDIVPPVTERGLPTRTPLISFVEFIVVQTGVLPSILATSLKECNSSPFRDGVLSTE